MPGTEKRSRSYQVARIEILQMIRPLRRDVVQQFLGQVAVRVNHPDAMPQRDVLQDQVSQQGGFSRAGFTDDVEVLPFVHGGNAKGHPPGKTHQAVTPTAGRVSHQTQVEGEINHRHQGAGTVAGADQRQQAIVGRDFGRFVSHRAGPTPAAEAQGVEE